MQYTFLGTDRLVHEPLHPFMHVLMVLMLPVHVTMICNVDLSYNQNHPQYLQGNFTQSLCARAGQWWWRDHFGG